MVSVRVPATSANLGPGFDCLGIALNLYNYIHVEKSDKFSIHLDGVYTSNLPTDETNLVWQCMLKLWKKAGIVPPTLSLTLENNIPPARGLGSSSAAIIGGLITANTLAGNIFSKRDILQMANEIEGHPDNITPALYGGITLAVETETGVLPRILVDKPHFSVLAVVPDFLLKTDLSRKVLSSTISRQDAVYNIAHVALLVEALMLHDYEHIKEGMKDKIHQDKRASLVPGLPETLNAALSSGAYGSALSGSGPTVLAIIPPEKAKAVSKAMLTAFEHKGLRAKCYELAVDSEGAVVL